jgi:hypothetical protein
MRDRRAWALAAIYGERVERHDVHAVAWHVHSRGCVGDAHGLRLPHKEAISRGTPRVHSLGIDTHADACGRCAHVRGS